MPQAETRRLAAIMFTDIVGFSRQMGADETRMLRLLETHNHIIQQAVTEHQGLIIKTIGDAFLVDFPSVVNAVQCAQHVQEQFRAHNGEKEHSEQIHVRIGIHSGDIVQRDGDVFGDGVNVASRLQALAGPDAICISHVVYREVEKKLSLGMVVSLGRPRLKNIAERFQVYALLSQPPQGVRQTLRVQRLKLKQWRRPLRVAVALLAFGLVGGGAIALRDHYFPSSPALPLPDKPSIVVLPFMSMSEDPNQDYFSDGLTEDLTTDLSKVSGLFVIAHNSAFTYKGKAVKAQDVSRELGVRYMLEGSVRKADNQVRITVQLVDATTGYHLWSERYDRELKDLFALQDEIREKIVTALKVKLTKEEQETFRRAPTDSLEAYNDLLQGWAHLRRSTKEDATQARQMFEKAIELDPQYAAAYVWLAYTYWWSWVWQWSQNLQTLERAFDLAQKAVALDDSLAVAHAILGTIYLWEKRHDQAIAEGERAVALDSNYAFGYVRLAETLNLAGKPAEAIGLAEKAMRLDPLHRDYHSIEVGFAYSLLGQHEAAISIHKRVLAHYPNNLGVHSFLAFSYSELGREEEAQAEVAEMLRISPKFSLEVMRQTLPFKDQAVSERVLAALRTAGLK